MNIQNEESFSFFEYISENFIGLLLLMCVFLIIYFVDYINRFNALILASSQGQIASPISIPNKLVKRRKIRKH